MSPLHNDVALVTGAASGIGKTISEHLVAQGARVLVVDRNYDGAAAVAAALNEGSDLPRAQPFAADVVHADQVQASVRAAVEHFGRLDIAVNNAGIEGPVVPMLDLDESSFDQLMAINVKGVWLCLKAELAQMLSQDDPRPGGYAIVNIASIAGLVGAPTLGAYAATKHAVVGLTRTAALEFARSNVRVNAVCPSVIDTPMVLRAKEFLPNLAKGIDRYNPMGRAGTTDEVAAAVAWLCSPAASFVTGACLPIDGAQSAA